MTVSQPSADPTAIARALIRCRSVTPEEGGALTYLAELLESHGFTVERMVFSAPDTPDVENLFATIGSGGPHLAFAGHTDVVPPGDESRWSHSPFAAEIVDDTLYGRGAVDMKGGIAAFLAAAFAFTGRGDTPPGTISLLITGDEEGPAINGTTKLVDWALKHGLRFDAAIVGEPTCVDALGDTIKIGRRGSLSATLRVVGRQGHVAYPDLADNPVTTLVRLLAPLAEARLDDGNEHFQPSNLEIVSIDVGNPAFNVIPAEARARLNVRFNDNWTPASLEAWLRTQLDAAAGGDAYALIIEPGASDSFLTRSENLVGELSAAILAETGLSPKLSTGGGTSDARFLKDYCPVVEFGLVGRTLHQIDECVAILDLAALAAIYRRFLEGFFAVAGRADADA